MRRLEAVVFGVLAIGCPAAHDAGDTSTSTAVSSESSEGHDGSSTTAAGDDGASTSSTSADSSSSSEGGSTSSSTSGGEPQCPDVEGMYYFGYDYGLFPVCRD